MTNTANTYDEIIQFIAKGVTPDDIIAFKPSDEMNDRVEDLIFRNKTTGLSDEETSELQHYLELDHIMTRAKAYARNHVAKS